MLFRWFIGLSMAAPVWDAIVFTNSRSEKKLSRWSQM